MNNDEYTKHIATGVIFVAECEWHTKQNPMAVWKAIGVATEHGIDIPDWAKDYLLEVSLHLLNGDAPDVSLGLKVGGGPGKLKQWKDFKKRGIACNMVAEEAQSGNHQSWNEVFTYVGEKTSVAPETIEKWWRDEKSLEWHEEPNLP